MEFFNISGDGRACVCRKKIMEAAIVFIMQGERKAIHVSVSGSSFAGTGLLPIKLELYYLCRQWGHMVPSKRCYCRYMV
jgi:hypothetical protein